MMDGAGRFTGSYDKVFLMLFGEYIPFYDPIPWFTKLFPEASNFSRGSEPGALSADGGRPRSTSSARSSVTRTSCPASRAGWPSSSPNAFVNITNDAWFGRTAEPYQHLALAVFRSVEHRLEMVRAVNTGVSAHIDAAGRVRAQTASVDPDELPPPTPEDACWSISRCCRAAASTGTSAICSGSCASARSCVLLVRARAPGRRGAGRNRR